MLALLGMKNTLARSPNMQLLIECSPELLDTKELLSFPHDEFAEISIVGGGRLLPTDTSPGKCNLWASRRSTKASHIT